MIDNNWCTQKVEEHLANADSTGLNKDLALLVYSSQLIGSNPDLVMHGGGNTSCKTNMKDIYEETIEVLHVKGSGWDLGSIEAQGLPPLRLEALRELRNLSRLSDEAMVSAQRANLMDQSSPNPSVETLLHAFLPGKFIFHTHSTPFLALANLPQSQKVLEELFDNKLAFVPYVMPGFDLAKLAIEIFEKNPEVEGLLLNKHGHFTWAEDARDAYDRVIDQTNIVEEWLQSKRTPVASLVKEVNENEKTELINNIQTAMRRVSDQTHPSLVFDIIETPEIISLVNSTIKKKAKIKGVATPDHVIRIKANPLLIEASILEQGAQAIEKLIQNFACEYKQYFDQCSAQSSEDKIMLDPLPKHAWVENIGIIGMGKTLKEAQTITDLSIQNLNVISDCEDSGGFSPISEKDLFEMEYWSLEQAKLGNKKPNYMQGKVIVVTGAAGTIGQSIVRKFAQEGAEVIAVDINSKAINSANFGKNVKKIITDVTNENSVDDLISKIQKEIGGIDILISNAGIAIEGSLIDLSPEDLRKSFEVNYFAHFFMASKCAKMMIAQQRKGQIMFNISKQAVNPGRNFGAYGNSKSALMFLMKQLALELGEFGIRVNGINADRIRSGILNDDFIKSRAIARDVSVKDYMTGNLLGIEVEANYVADAFFKLATSPATTGHIMTVDGGNIEASLR